MSSLKDGISIMVMHTGTDLLIFFPKVVDFKQFIHSFDIPFTEIPKMITNYVKMEKRR